MIKILGNLIIFLAAISLGFYMARRYQERYRNIIGIRSGLYLLEEEMLTLGRPLPQALERTGGQLEGSVERFFQLLLSYYQELSYEETLNLVLGDFQREEKRILREFLFSLGQGDREHQKSLFKTLQLRLSPIEEEAREEAKRYGKIWHYSGFLLGFMLIIILY